ncbi:MAG: STAS domain-containing protein [Nitrospirota bacterium]
MTIKFEKENRRLKTMICLSGRLQAKHLEELKRQLEGTRSRIALDLNGVTLVDVESVRFLNACEKGGVELLNSWPYIQEWMIREQGRKG